MSGGTLNDKIKDLGDWAEDSFSRACSKAGATRNKSQQDRTGWDYLVEFAPTPKDAVPADLRPIERSARVQIKSKRSGKPTVSLKLSNAIRFAKDPLPCFVILYLATSGGEPVRVYARHFWEHEIEYALRRAREAHAGGRDDLHKLSVVLTFSENDDHTDDLIDWIKAQTETHGDQYAQAKGRLVQTLGYEDGFIHGNIQFEADHLEALVDHQIGLLPTAPPLTVIVKQRRFGIDAATPLFQGKPTTAHLQSHPTPCRIRVRGKSGSDEWFDGSLYVPAIPDLPAEFRKLRVVADFLEIVLGQTSGGEVIFHIDPDVGRSLPELRRFINVLKAAHEGPLQFQIQNEEGVPFTFTVAVPVDWDSHDLEQLSNVIECFEVASAGMLPAPLRISLTEIFAAWNSIVEFNGLVAGTNMRARFTLDRQPEVTLASASSIFLYGWVDVGRWSFLVVVRRSISNFLIEGRSGSFECGDARVVESIVHEGSGEDCLLRLQHLYSECVRTEGVGVLQMYGGDYREMLSGNDESPVILQTGDDD